MPAPLRLVSGFVAATVLAGPFPAAAVEAGEAVPALVAKNLDGARPPVALASLRGQVVYVDFWASWCVPCRLSMPVLDGLYRKHGSAGFTVVGVNKDVSGEDARRFLGRVPVTFTLATDADDAVAKAFAVKAMPSGYLVDRKGVVRYVHRGFTDETAAALESQVASLLGEGR